MIYKQCDQSHWLNITISQYLTQFIIKCKPFSVQEVDNVKCVS